MTGPEQPLYSIRMEIEDLYENTMPAEAGELDNTTETAATSLAILAERVEQLMRVYEQLLQENQALREQEIALRTECASLREQNEQSRSRIEAMVVRLKSLEQPS